MVEVSMEDSGSTNDPSSNIKLASSEALQKILLQLLLSNETMMGLDESFTGDIYQLQVSFILFKIIFFILLHSN